MTIIAKIGSLKAHFYSSFSFRDKLLKTAKIISVIFSFKYKVHNLRIQVILYFINLNHQSLDVSMVIASIIIVF